MCYVNILRSKTPDGNQPDNSKSFDSHTLLSEDDLNDLVELLPREVRQRWFRHGSPILEPLSRILWKQGRKTQTKTWVQWYREVNEEADKLPYFYKLHPDWPRTLFDFVQQVWFCEDELREAGFDPDVPEDEALHDQIRGSHPLKIVWTGQVRPTIWLPELKALVAKWN
jgi:hypothetical protein